jgi:hypothetical protein
MVKKRAPTARKRGSTKKRVPQRKHIELRPVRKQVERVVRQLETVSEPNDRIRKVLEDMRMTLAAINDTCGPVMSVPLA